MKPDGTIRMCPACWAPNPKRLAQCHSCGADLDPKAVGRARQQTRSRTCRNCTATLPPGADACTGCGLLVGGEREERAGPVGFPVTSIPGWQIERRYGGDVVLTRKVWKGFGGGEESGFLAWCALGAAFSVLLGVLMAVLSGDPAAIAVGVLLVGLVAAGWVGLMRAEETLYLLDAGVEHGWQVGPLRRVLRLSGGVLALRRHSAAGWTLSMRGVERTVILGQQPADLRETTPPPWLLSVASAVAGKTGWSIQIPDPGTDFGT